MPAVTLIIYIYDSYNKPLRKSGINIDLYDSTTNVLLASDVSADLNPPANEWGGKLSFTIPLAKPVDIVFTDAAYEYPGNTIRYLNGDAGGRVDVDLRKLPTKTGGQAAPPKTASPTDLVEWVDGAPKWTGAEKDAVKQLIFNYFGLIIARQGNPTALDRLGKINENWSVALTRLGLSYDFLARNAVATR
jgi:hypothetical protein